MSEVTVGDLLNIIGRDGEFTVSAGGVRGLNRSIGRRTVQRVGIALTGYTEHLVPDRLQLLGRSELGYIDTIINVVVHSDTLTTVLKIPVNYHFLGSGLAVLLGTVITAVVRVVSTKTS